jgi:hypothetical protein
MTTGSRQVANRSILARKALDLQNVRILLDLFSADSQLNVYAGEREVRPPAAPTTRGIDGGRRWLFGQAPNGRNRLEEGCNYGGTGLNALWSDRFDSYEARRLLPA